MTITVEIITNQVGQNVYRVKRNGEWIGDYINGVNTQTSGIQEALNYAVQTGDPVELGPGTFNVNAAIQLPNMSGLVLRGAGKALTSINQAGGYGGTIMQWADPSAANQNYYIGHFAVNAPNGNNTIWVIYLTQNETAAN
ncbi:MAG: hypothetical protein RXR82_06090, partial [Nitrososphaeria archaeon]